MRRIDHLRRQDGNITILALALLGFCLVPMLALTIATSQVSNASTQAAGMAFNLAYGAENRAVDVCATQRSASVQLKMSDASDPDPGCQARYGVTNSQIMSDLNVISQRQQATAAASSGSQGTTFSTDAVRLFNVGTDPVTARCEASGQAASCLPPVNASCNATPGTAMLSGAGVPICWRSSSHDAALAGQYPTLLPAWDQFTSGAEAQVRFSVNVPGLGVVAQTRSGSASFGRPCQTGVQHCAQ